MIGVVMVLGVLGLAVIGLLRVLVIMSRKAKSLYYLLSWKKRRRERLIQARALALREARYLNYL